MPLAGLHWNLRRQLKKRGTKPVSQREARDVVNGGGTEELSLLLRERTAKTKG